MVTKTSSPGACDTKKERVETDGWYAVLPVQIACDIVMPRPAAPAGPVFMLVGDSITQGRAGDFTWRYRLHTHLAATMTPAGSRVEFAGPRRDLYDLADHRHGNQDYADAKFDPDHNAIWGRLLADARAGIAADVAEFRPTHLLVLLGITFVSAEQWLRRRLRKALGQ